MTDRRITKRKVTLTAVTAAGTAPDGRPLISTQVQVDYWDTARPGLIDALTADAHARGWQSVEVGTEPDAGPAGWDGATVIPAGINHRLAGQTFPATSEA